MATYNQYSTSPIRQKLTDISATDTIIGKLADQAPLMRNISKVVNRTWVYSASGNVVDANQCEHVVDRLWLLGCGNINCTGIWNGSSTKYLNDADYDTSCFSGVFTARENMGVNNSVRVKYNVNADGSTGSSAYFWWLRSAYSNGGNNVGCVNSGGYVSYYQAYYSSGCSPALTIG